MHQKSVVSWCIGNKRKNNLNNYCYEENYLYFYYGSDVDDFLQFL